MKKTTKIPQPAIIAGVVAFFLLVALAGWFLLISPQRKTAADLTTQIDDTQKNVAQARALIAQVKSASKIRVADVFRLTKAMPDQADMSGVILELNHIAKESGISFDSITPQGSMALSGYQAVPLQVVFNGNFYALSDFLFRLRGLVDVRRGTLDATGRLFLVDNLAFDESPAGFPQIHATLTVDAFVYGNGPVTAPPASTATTGASTTAPASTSATTTTPATPPSTGAAAAGALP
ncbi:MAG: type 4a pilus biogenesis protein PilO [Actinomycetota bacterium]|nr:type 4a pilus biogenesis protein PilO [Actinomycetota bacterium]